MWQTLVAMIWINKRGPTQKKFTKEDVDVVCEWKETDGVTSSVEMFRII